MSGLPDTGAVVPDPFDDELAVLRSFDEAADPARYRPLPAGWRVGNADIVKSTQAKAQGRAKAVNLAGAAVIAGVTNALGGRQIPYVFGGDGASFAVPPGLVDAAGAALASVAQWSASELELPMRAGIVPIEAIRQAGWDVRVARYAASPAIRYAMFSGGGVRWAESQIKQGRFVLPAAGPGARPDLSGLSCNWEPADSTLGVILTLIIVPRSAFDDPRFAELVARLNRMLADRSQARCPLPDGGPPLNWPPSGFELMTIVSRQPGESALLTRLRLAASTLGSALLMWTGARVGAFDARRYRREMVENADFRGYDDGLRMTLDCTTALSDRVEALLAAAKAEGICRYGLHREASALMTCIVPMPSRSDHVHFVDGATGGYSRAAQQLKDDA